MCMYLAKANQSAKICDIRREIQQQQQRQHKKIHLWNTLSFSFSFNRIAHKFLSTSSGMKENEIDWRNLRFSFTYVTAQLQSFKQKIDNKFLATSIIQFNGWLSTFTVYYFSMHFKWIREPSINNKQSTKDTITTTIPATTLRKLPTSFTSADCIWFWASTYSTLGNWFECLA